MLILLEEGGERKSASNINYLLEEFGVSINNGKEWVEGGGAEGVHRVGERH